MQNQTETSGLPGGYAHPEIMDLEKVGTPMERSANNRIQQEMEASKIASETLQDAAYTRVDQHTLEIIHQIFPTPNKGLEFTASILRYAQVIQNVLPGLEDMGEQVAVINVRTIRVLAGLIKWGYDTTHKYITTFCALGLLRKAKQGGDRLLVFPLERYQLPVSLQPLDGLITKSRPKVQQFVRQVKARLLQAYPGALAQANNDGASRFEGPAVYSPDACTSDTLYQSLFSLMESEGIDPTTGRHLSKRIITEVLSQFEAPASAVQAPTMTYVHAATGTLDSRSMATWSTRAPVAQAGDAYRSTHLPTRASHHPQESIAYWRESTDPEPESTRYQTKYPFYYGESTDPEPESTRYQTKYTLHQSESTSRSARGRLSGEKVSTTGRLARRKVSASPIYGETQTDQAGYSTPQVSQQGPTEYPVPLQGKEQRAKLPVLPIEEAFSRIMKTWDILTSYQYILEQQLIDWEADGIPTSLIEQLYLDIDVINTDFKARGSAVASRAFFLRTLEKRCIQKLAEEYGLVFVDLYNIIMFRTNREHFMLEETFTIPEAPVPVEEPQLSPDPRATHFQQYPADYAHNSSQPSYNEYQAPVDPYAHEYQQPVDSRQREYQYQYPVDSDSSEYQAHVDSQRNEYQHLADSQQREYQQPVDFQSNGSTPSQQPVDSQQREYQRPVDPQWTTQPLAAELTAQESTRDASLEPGEDELNAQESTPRRQSLAEIIDQGALADGIPRLRIPRALRQQNYSPEFANVYVTYNIKKLINKIYTDVTLRNDGKTFFAEIFDTTRVSAARNWYNKLFTKCSSPEVLLAAFVETIIDLHSRGNGTIVNPGGLFNKKIAECEKTISERTLEHINTYCEQPYEAFALDIARLASRASLGIS